MGKKKNRRTERTNERERERQHKDKRRRNRGEENKRQKEEPQFPSNERHQPLLNLAFLTVLVVKGTT